MEELLKSQNNIVQFSTKVVNNIQYYTFVKSNKTYKQIKENFDNIVLGNMRNELSSALSMPLTDDQLICIYYVCSGGTYSLSQLLVRLRIEGRTTNYLTFRDVFTKLFNDLPLDKNSELAGLASKGLKIAYSNKDKKVFYSRFVKHKKAKKTNVPKELKPQPEDNEVEVIQPATPVSWADQE